MNWKPIRTYTVALAIASLLAAGAGPAPAGTAYAAVPKLEQIRVALALEAGKLKSTLPAVTVAGTKGMDAALATAAATYSWPADAALLPTVRATGDQFAVKLLETNDLTQAKRLKEQLAGASGGGMVTIHAIARSGKPVYQVKAGGYATKAAAASALAAMKLQPALSVMMNDSTVQGPLRWNAGTYAQLAEAEKTRALLLDNGLEAELALVPQAAGLAYEVWTGAEADEQALTAYKLKVLKVQPAMALVQADTSRPYALMAKEAASSAAGAPDATLLLVPLQGTKLVLLPKEGELRIAEKNNRTYRGIIEISYYNGKLAVINQLPLEQYLYSVVTGEMGTGWPLEALKAQAVAARTYALRSGIKYEIAHVSDSTLDQLYNGEESADVIKAVDATAGEVLLGPSGLIDALFSSNAGGMTSTGQEIWGNEVSYLKAVPSPDEGAAKGKAVWRRGVLSDGKVVYVHSDYLKLTGIKNPAGLPVYESTEDGVNARREPYVDNVKNPSVAKLKKGEWVTVFDEAAESNAYSWTRGPYSADEWLKTMNASLTEPIQGPLSSLEISKRGDSGRVTELTANGRTISVAYPDSYRMVLGGLPSTRFEIERTGGYTIQGAGLSSSTQSTAGGMYALSGSGQAQPVDSSSYFVLGGDGKVRHAAADAGFLIKGSGNGHGLGMSQWGARGLTDLGYDYRKILLYYYDGVTITKE